MQRYTVYIFLENCSTCFGWYFHSSSGAHSTVSTASGTCQQLLLHAAIVEDAVDGVECAVEQFPKK